MTNCVTISGRIIECIQEKQTVLLRILVGKELIYAVIVYDCLPEKLDLIGKDVFIKGTLKNIRVRKSSMTKAYFNRLSVFIENMEVIE